MGLQGGGTKGNASVSGRSGPDKLFVQHWRGPVKFNLVRGWAFTINLALPGLLQLIWPYPGFYTALAVVAQHLIVAVAAQQLTHCRLQRLVRGLFLICPHRLGQYVVDG